MTHIAETAHKGKPNRSCPSTGILYYGLHLVSIGRDAFEAIGDQPIYDHHPRATGSRPLTWRGHLEPDGLLRDKRKRIKFGAGLLDRIVAALREQEVDVRGADQEQGYCRPSAKAQPESAWSERLQRAHGRLRSLQLLPKLEERICAVADLCKLQSETHVLVVVKNDSDARTVAHMLAQATGRVATWRPDQPRGWPWLLVKSLTSLAGCAPMSWEFVIFLDCELALSKTAIEFLMAAQESPRIGFLTRDEHQLQEVERAALEGLFGPVLTDNRDSAGISVAWLRPTTGKPMPFSSSLERKRNQVWQNDPRNRLIARAARALSDNNSKALEMLGLRAAAASGLLGADLTQTPTVAILVENTEHGQQLARLLPGWRLEEAGYTPPPAKNVPDDKVIMTLARAAETVLATSVIVYAAGGDDDWNEHLWGLAWGVDRLIVDVADAYDDRSRAETHSRAASYRRRGIPDGPRSDPPQDATRPVESPSRRATGATGLTRTEEGGAV